MAGGVGPELVQQHIDSSKKGFSDSIQNAKNDLELNFSKYTGTFAAMGGKEMQLLIQSVFVRNNLADSGFIPLEILNNRNVFEYQFAITADASQDTHSEILGELGPYLTGSELAELLKNLEFTPAFLLSDEVGNLIGNPSSVFISKIGIGNFLMPAFETKLAISLYSGKDETDLKIRATFYSSQIQSTDPEN